MDEQGYAGPATLAIGDDRYEVRVELRGVFQPIDGRFHWYGRVAAHDGLAAALGPARAAGTLTTPEGQAACEVSDPDPWQRYRVSGRSTPPFAVTTDLPPEEDERIEPDEATEATKAGQPAASDQGHVRVAIIGTGFGGLGAAHRAAALGPPRLRHPGAGRLGRRHLAGQHLSGLRLRRALAPVLVLVRAQPGLVAQLLAAAGDPRATWRTSPTTTGCAATSGSAPRSTRPAGTPSRRAGGCRPAGAR